MHPLPNLHFAPSKVCADQKVDCRPTLFSVVNRQDQEDGGISDRPEDMVDVFHTFFGIAGLSLMGYKGICGVDPTFALPTAVIERIKLSRVTLN